MTTVVAAYGYLSAEDEPTRWQPDGIVASPDELLAWVHPALEWQATHPTA
jgi:phosphoglycolate phosphatase-like HAD superfamily hydrolase